MVAAAVVAAAVGGGAADSEEEDLSISVLGDEGSDGDDKADQTLFRKALKLLCLPLDVLFEYTCINCEKGGPYEKWYPLTFCVSFVWVSWFSTIISSVASRWIAFSPSWANGSLFGLLCAVGAEIPDTIQSVTMARRGYGSMAVSNAIGSQVLNICIGLGLPPRMQGHTVLPGLYTRPRRPQPQPVSKPEQVNTKLVSFSMQRRLHGCAFVVVNYIQAFLQ